jgi:uncharacterized membrane protein YfcA
VSFLIVALAALFAAGLTLYSGFGLGTLLLPVFALFFPVEVAVGATAVVHGANNVFKVSLLGRFADRDTVLRFGLPAIVAAVFGAALLGWFSVREPLLTWSLGAWEAQITPLKLVMGALMFFFALFELLPRLRGIRFDRAHYLVGGLLSGFFGGLSGHQGALRSAFLVKTGMDTRTFVGTSSMIGLLVDAVRLATYFGLLLLAGNAVELPAEGWGLVVTGCLAAFAGVLLGKRYLEKITMDWVQTFTGVLLLAIAGLLGFGLI